MPRIGLRLSRHRLVGRRRDRSIVANLATSKSQQMSAICMNHSRQQRVPKPAPQGPEIPSQNFGMIEL
jgi:hypothetical protein